MCKGSDPVKVGPAYWLKQEYHRRNTYWRWSDFQTIDRILQGAAAIATTPQTYPS